MVVDRARVILRRLPEPQTASQTKATLIFGRVPPEEHARVARFGYPFLELETSSQLNLPLAEKSAVSAGNTVEARGATAKV